jgi:hypothetical protein
MKKSDLRRIIQEEIEKVLSEAPEVAPAEKEKTKTKPSTTPSEEDDEWGTPSIIPEPKKATQSEAAKKISEKISKRYTDILKKKK